MAIDGIVADADAKGHVSAVITVCQSAGWSDLWAEVAVPLFAFDDLGLSPDSPDADVWRRCQERNLVLITGNRNAEGETSLEQTIRTEGTSSSLPVFTLANRDRVLSDRRYAERAAARLIELLADIDLLRGAGRVWLP